MGFQKCLKKSTVIFAIKQGTGVYATHLRFFSPTMRHRLASISSCEELLEDVWSSQAMHALLIFPALLFFFSCPLSLFAMLRQSILICLYFPQPKQVNFEEPDLGFLLYILFC